MQLLSKIISETKLNKQVRDILIEDIFGLTREQVITRQDFSVSAIKYIKYKYIEKRILSGYPYQYLINNAFFYKSKFYVNKNVLCPRLETEIMVTKALDLVKRLDFGEEDRINVIDIGTGSGCIAVSLAKETKESMPKKKISFFAVDISKKAVMVARKNIKKHKVDVNCFKSDLLLDKKLPKKYDLILANLPYLTEDYAKENPALKYEPIVALCGGKKGLAVILKLIQELPEKLELNGTAIIEIDPEQSSIITNECSKINLSAEVIRDFKSSDRFILIRHCQ